MAAAKSEGESSRVVDTNFRVDGWHNVYVADASVFPTGITVNPQWTIMALASLAAQHVLVEHDPSRVGASGVSRVGRPPAACELKVKDAAL